MRARVPWAAPQHQLGLTAPESEHQILRASTDPFDGGDLAVGHTVGGQPGLDHGPVDRRVHEFSHREDGTRRLHGIAMQVH
jgi:hypothetical protein